MRLNGKKSKHEFIAGALRRELLTGKYTPGTRLPKQSELAQRFQVGNGTITQVLQRLSREGFLTSRRRIGIIVRNKLPHLNNIAIALLAKNWSGSHWQKYYTAIANAATSLSDELGRPIRVLEGLGLANGESRRDLTELVQTHQLAGIIFPHTPYPLLGNPILEEPGIPRVAVMSAPLLPGIDTMISTNDFFIERALDYLASRDRHRIAVLSIPGTSQMATPKMQSLLESLNMTCPPCWDLAFSLDAPESAMNIMRLMMRAGQVDRPDGLIITNDNLVDDTIAGLLAEGIKVPDELEVVAHCNFPWPPVKTMPIKRLGLDVPNLLRCGIDLIDRKRTGQEIPSVVNIPAVWEDSCVTQAESQNLPPV